MYRCWYTGMPVDGVIVTSFDTWVLNCRPKTIPKLHKPVSFSKYNGGWIIMTDLVVGYCRYYSLTVIGKVEVALTMK